MTAQGHLSGILGHFPPVKFAFAYGSAVYQQPGLYKGSPSNSQGPMVDFIFAVDDPTTWHSENIRRNRDHYSLLGALGPKAVVKNAECLGVGVHFNTMVPIDEQLIKYGVIGVDTLHDDLLNWKHLYIGGRLQKPVLAVQPNSDVAQANAKNLEAALALGLLLTPAQFSSEDLFRRICGLSYMGDIRVGLAEDSRKVDRIVAGSLEGLRELYSVPITGGTVAQQAELKRCDEDRWVQAESDESRAKLVAALPSGMLSRLASAVQMPPPACSNSSAAAALAERVVGSGRCQALLRGAVAGIVRASSRRQAVAGLLAAGGTKSFYYLMEKMGKAWRSRRGTAS